MTSHAANDWFLALAIFSLFAALQKSHDNLYYAATLFQQLSRYHLVYYYLKQENSQHEAIKKKFKFMNYTKCSIVFHGFLNISHQRYIHILWNLHIFYNLLTFSTIQNFRIFLTFYLELGIKMSPKITKNAKKLTQKCSLEESCGLNKVANQLVSWISVRTYSLACLMKISAHLDLILLS